ncbi:MAG TPA: UDP-N-acetylmuramoyl-tripeptide--D-alanyl-D-alanine ligase, partial [Candidatus Saccharimonadales bacterium]|nr:UDP-N-acetylmuramoyl-tripeptide--D-alanyl-D-alanine ligase [Candidatus Saccharimonadales bacterium]
LPRGAAALVVDDQEAGLRRWAAGHRRRFGPPLVAVTGSNGKTSVRSMLAQALAVRGPVLATQGNLNNQLGVPLTLVRLAAGHAAAVVEMGMNHAGELTELCELAAPTAGVITNVARAHLEGLGSVEAVGRAKSELVDYLEHHGGVAVLNADDPVLMHLNRGRRVRLRTFGLAAGADVRGVEVRARGLEGASFRVAGGPAVELRVPGVHNVRNALAALAAAEALGVPLDEGARALAGFGGLEHGRLEPVELGGVQLLDDTYNANPDSLAAAVEVVRGIPVRGRRLLALGDMLELGPDSEALHEAAGRALAGVDAVWAAGRFAEALVRGARAAGVADAEAFAEPGALVGALPGRLRPGDLLLVKGSRGMRMESLVAALRERATLRN